MKATSASQGSFLVAACLVVLLASCRTVPPSQPAPTRPAPPAAPAVAADQPFGQSIKHYL
jgi:hypothetical protein